ncbi:MAG: ATP-dependent Clp protease adaptor ClpS [Acidobacteriota bacterium]
MMPDSFLTVEAVDAPWRSWVLSVGALAAGPEGGGRRLAWRASSGSPGDAPEDDLGEQIATRERTRVRRPRKFKVLLHNDDYTSMDFVIQVLKTYFYRSDLDAQRIALEVHHKGVGIAGVYPWDVAETKVAQVTRDAREQGMPLRLSIEAE